MELLVVLDFAKKNIFQNSIFMNWIQVFGQNKGRQGLISTVGDCNLKSRMVKYVSIMYLSRDNQNQTDTLTYKRIRTTTQK